MLHIMYSCALFLRKPASQIRVFASQNLQTARYFTTRSFRGRKSQNENQRSNYWFPSSGLVFIGFSSLALCSSYSFWLYSSVGYADDGAQTEQQLDRKQKFLFKDNYRRKVFFKYEKRIRTRSPPEKVFEYFASLKMPNGEVYMTPSDLMRAVVPVFPPSEAEAVRVGFLKGESFTSELKCPPSDFFLLFDTNSDGLITFTEYIFFVTILRIPESSFSVAFKMFDVDGDGGIDKEEFKKVMALMRTQNRQGASHRDGKRFGLKVSGSVEDGGLLEYFFGKDGNNRLGHERFVRFLQELHEEILKLEFRHYDFKSKGTIAAKDFILSMVASADMKYIDKFLDQADELSNEPSLRDIRITFDEFKNFAELRRRLEPFSIALFSYGTVNGLLSKQDFKRAAHQVCGVLLSDRVIDLVFYVFDENRDGSLSLKEFLRVMQRRETDQEEAGFGRLIRCWLQCTKNCTGKFSY